MGDESPMPVCSTNPGRSRWEGWNRYVLLYALALLLLLGVAWAARSAGNELKSTLQVINRLQNGNKELAVFLQEIVDLETAQRGYLLTRDEKYLQPYTSAEKQIDAQLIKVYDTLGDDRATRTELDEIGLGVTKKRQEITATLLLYQQRGPEAALAMMRSGLGRTAMDSIRSRVAGLSMGVRMAITQQQQVLEDVVAMRNRTIFVALGLAIAASFAGMMLLQRHLLALRNEERSRARAERADIASREKSTFLANISHEIRTPMNAIFGFSQLLSERVVDGESKRYVDAIVSSGRALLALINDVLDLSKIEAGKLDVHPAPMNLRETIESAVMIFAQLALEKGLSVTAQIDAQVPDGLVLDQARLRQMLFNLIGNAVKYTDRGRIVVRASAIQHHDETHVDCLIEVEDTGVGIALADRERIFDPFIQANPYDDQHEGTGLGLSITRRLAQLMNGTISVDSQPDQGSCFRLHLANVALAPLPESIPLLKGKLSDLPQSTILVVDDVMLNRQLIHAMFRGTHHRLIEAQDGLQAVQLTRSERPNLVLMDIRMPGMDGIAALEQIRADPTLDTIRVIAVTASSLLGEEARLRKRFDGYIRKPVSVEMLYAELRRVLNEQGADGRPAALALVLQHPQEWPAVRASLAELERTVWVELHATHALRESARFGEQLGGLAQRCGCVTLMEYAAHLHSAASQADSMALERMLDEYPALLRRLDDRHSEFA